MKEIKIINNHIFTLAGVPYGRIYQPIKMGENHFGIYNVYDSRQQILGSTRYDEVSIDGTTYSSLNELMIDLVEVIYNTAISMEEYATIKEMEDKIQESYNAIVNSIGTGFQGAIKIADTPTEAGIYNPTEVGVYPRAGGLEYAPEGDDEGFLVQFIFDGSEWVKNRVVLPMQDISGLATKEELSENYPESSLIGVVTHPPGSDMVGGILNPFDENSDTWRAGYIDNTGIYRVEGPWIATRYFISLPKGDYISNLLVSGNASFVIYNPDKTIYQVIQDVGNVSGSGSFTFSIPGDGYSIKFSLSSANRDVRYLHNTSVVKRVTSDVFILSSEIDEKISSSQASMMSDTYGVINTPTDTNLIQNLADSNVDNRFVYGRGFLKENGDIQPDSGWYYSVDYLHLRKGRYEIHFFQTGNARSIVYNLDKTIRTPISNSGYTDLTRVITIESDALFRFSHRQAEGQEDRLPTIYIKNLEDIPPYILTSNNVNDYVEDKAGIDMRQLWHDQHSPRMKRPVVTLISDDLHEYNDTWYVPLLDEYGVKSTFAVIGQRTQEADNGIANGFLPSSYVEQLYKDGHNIASHTWSHRYMNTLSLEEVEDELSRTKLYLEQFTNVPVNMFVSPFGVRGRSIDNIVSKYYDANFISGYGTLNPPPLDSYFLNRVSFDSSESAPTLLWESRLKPAVDEAISENNWLIFAVHPQYGQYRGALGIDRKNELRTLIEYCLENNVQILTADKAYDYWKNPVQVGVQRVSDRYYKLGMDGSEINEGYFPES